MEIYCLKGTDIHKTRSLYEEVFRDSKAYTDYFYQKAENGYTAMAAVEDKRVIGELFLVPKVIRWNGKWENVFYIYGVATAEKHRGKGIMKALLKHAEMYALQEEVTLLYLIPVNEKIYEPFNFQLVKKGSVKNYELSGKDSKIMLQSVSASKKFPYEAFQMLEQEVYENDAVLPLRDKTYFAERIIRAEIEDGDIRAFYQKDNGKLKGICVLEEREGILEVVDIICHEGDKGDLMQCYLSEKNLPAIREHIFPIMVKCLDRRWNILKDTKVFLNDEI